MVLQEVRQDFLMTFHSDKHGNVKEYLSVYLYDQELASLPTAAFEAKPELLYPVSIESEATRSLEE
jgi:hypothetical protein